MALNIQRARDHGLGDYNTAREEYKLPRITTWTEINPDLAAEKPEVTVHLILAVENYQLRILLHQLALV